VKNVVNECVVVFNNVAILKQYSGYRYDQTKKHYSALWNEKEVYNKIN
jgi:hypothetical protein